VKRTFKRLVIGVTLTVTVTGAAATPAFASPGTGSNNDRGSSVSHCSSGASVTTPKGKSPVKACNSSVTFTPLIRLRATDGVL
jgi:hypothetical protein